MYVEIIDLYPVSAELKDEGGVKCIEITARGLSNDKIYVVHVVVNGYVYDRLKKLIKELETKGG